MISGNRGFHSPTVSLILSVLHFILRLKLFFIALF